MPEIMVKKIEELDSDGVGWVTRTVASNVLLGLRHIDRAPIDSDDESGPGPALAALRRQQQDAYTALQKLEQNGSLRASNSASSPFRQRLTVVSASVLSARSRHRAAAAPERQSQQGDT